ncbi:hypothetical protein HPC62_06565 [Thermoleptolyngbya sichuanensis A183]|uniref:Uncharacterized protein n=1 Tax=Thermoleptolyngbya sichuanensis A183 TaxID=2737172 RepID=A0A6M8B5Z7_9CYAN|nr:hypothetical protein [Thermoleptolyngbya sichuanensis]QKD81908.1 hypothetical protein HPC62_06565 [Thermoleptolyngbya sichuanensis A183]
MTYQPAQLQDLIRAIDEVLGKSSPRLPWVMSGEADQQRRVLEETRRYLAQMQQQGTPAAGSALAHDPMNQGYAVPLSPTSPAESAQQVLQAMLQEMTYLRTTVMQPLRNDLEVLYRQRDRLLQEIHELESQRQQAVLTDATPPPAATLPAADQQRLISEFLQTLMSRLQADLSGQVAQMLTEIEAQAAGAGASVAEPHRPSAASEASDSAVSPSATEVPALTPAERLQQIQRIQAQSDQLLLKLDNSLRVIFESLQSNIETYQESLSLGLDKMNTLGQQGESIFAAMVNRLAEQLSREASHYLQASIQDAEWQPATSLPQSSARPPAEPPAPQPTTEPATEQWPPASLETAASSARPQSDSLDPIDQLLSELEDELTVFQVPEPVSDEDLTVFQVPELDLDEELTVFQVPEPSPDSGAADRVASESESDPMPADTRPMGSTAYPGLLDEIDDLEALELLTQELERLELASVPELPELEDDAEFASLDDGDEDLTMFQIDESAMTDFRPDEPLGDPRTVLQVDAEEAEETEEAKETEETEETEEASVSPGLSIEDLDSALDLLGQISTQLDAELEQAGSTDGPDSADLTTGFGLDADSVSGTDSYDELDAFYESLFGIDAAGATGETAETADEEPVDQHLSDAEQRSRVQLVPDMTDVAEPSSVSEGESDLPDLSGSTDLTDLTDLSDTPPIDAELGSLDSLDQALFGGQADPASDATDATDAAIASPSVDELVDLLSEFMNVPAAAAAGEARAGEIADPAEPTAQTESSALQPPHSTERSPEAVEHLLFGESPEPPPAEEPDGGLSSPQPNKPEVIRSLNDLLQLMAAESAEESAVGLPASGLATDAEDRYEPANPGEDLLGGDDVLSSPRPDVQVTQTTLEQLVADLSDLEGLAADAFSTDLAALSSSAAAPATDVSETDSETSSSFTDSLADWGQFPQESLRESPDPFPAAGSVADPTDEGQSYWQGSSFAQNAPTEEDLFISSLFPVEDGSDDEMTLLLDGPPPGLSTPLPEKAIAPLTTPESLADWVNALDETELPPDREDLSLSDFQAVMQTEPAPFAPLDGMGAIADVQTPLHPADYSPLVEESLEDSFADDFSDDSSGDFSSDFSGDLLAEDLFSGLEGSSADSAAVSPAEVPSAAPPATPAENVGLESASLEDFSADFAVPASPAPSQGVPANSPDLAPPPAIPNSLEDLFAELPPAPQPSPRQPSVPPPSDSLPDSILENLSLSVPAPPPGEAALTLSGLESLFEDLPSVGEVTPVPPPGSPSTSLTAADLTSLLDDAEPAPAADLGNPVNPVDEAQPADSPDSSSEAKKKSSNPPNPREPRGFGRLQPNTRRPQ